MKIETWGEETEKKWSTFDELEKKKKKTTKEKKLLRLKRNLDKEKRRVYKPSFSFRISPLISQFFSSIVLFFIILGGLWYVKITVIDDLSTEIFVDAYGLSPAIINIMWYVIVFMLPFYFISKMFMRGSSGYV